MATRFRLTSDATAPAVSPALQSYSHTQGTVRTLLTSDTSALTTSAYTPDGADHLVAGDAHHIQFVSDPMVAGITFTNGNTIKMCVQALEAHAGNNLFLQCFVSIVSQDGTTVRRTLCAKTADGVELATALTSRFHTTTQSGATYVTVSGDRLVVELSVTGTPTGAGGVQGHNASLRWGGNGAGGDLLETDAQTDTTLNPWIEFVPNVSFLNPQLVTPTTATLTMTGYAPTVLTPRTVTPSTAALTTTTYEPTVTVALAGVQVIPSTASLVLTSYVPTVRLPKLATPTTAALTTTTFAPTVRTPRTVTPSTSALVITRYAPSVLTPRRVVPTTASLITTRFIPTVTTTNHIRITPSTASLVTTRYAPTVVATNSIRVTPVPINMFLTSFPPVVTAALVITPSPASLVLNTFAPTVTSFPLAALNTFPYWRVKP